MAIINRAGFEQYCLNRLGSPLVKINVAPEQISDRVDDALQLYREYHYDATEELFLAHTVTQEDIDNGYIPVPETVVNVQRILQVSDATEFNFMDQRYHAMRDMAQSMWSSLDVTDYTIKQTFYSLLRGEMDSDPTINYVRHRNIVRIHDNMTREYPVGSVIVIEAIGIVDDANIWDDRWLKAYATALIKRQWGENLGKFQNVQLIGGVTMNGDELYQKAEQDIAKLEEQLKEEYQEPPEFFWG